MKDLQLHSLLELPESTIRESLIPLPSTTYPWERIDIDLFTQDNAVNMIVVYYYYNFPRVIKLNQTSSNAVIPELKNFSLSMVFLIKLCQIEEHNFAVKISDNSPNYGISTIR